MLLVRRRIYLGLRYRVGLIEEERDHFFKDFFTNVHCAVNAITWLRPIHFANRDFRFQWFFAIPKLDSEQIATQYHRYSMIGIAVPRCCISRQEPLSPDKIFSPMMQDLLACCHGTVVASLFLSGKLEYPRVNRVLRTNGK